MCGSVTILDSEFSGLTSEQTGGALSLSADTIRIQNCNFTNNKAGVNGGALAIFQTDYATVTESTFESNHAKNGGGALYFDCEPSDTENCEILLLQDNFIANYAGLTGGALQYDFANFTQVIDTSFVDNVATQGDNLGSYVKSLWFVDILTQEKLSIDRLDGYKVSLVPGHPFVVSATIYDQEGRQYSSENNAIARLRFVNPETIDPKFAIGNGDVLAKNGTFLFDQLYFQLTPGTEISISLTLEGIDNLQYGTSIMQEVFKFNVSALQCPVGEYFSNQLTCIRCGAGSYLMTVSEFE